MSPFRSWVNASLLFSRWPVSLVISTLRLLLQGSQRWRRRWEWNLLQWTVHLQLREPLRGQLPARYRHPWAGQPTDARANVGQASQERPRSASPAAAAVRAASQERPTPDTHRKLPWHQHLQEAASERKVDCGRGAGEVHPGLPQDQDSRAISWAQVHVASRPPAQIPSLRNSGNLKVQATIAYVFTTNTTTIIASTHPTTTASDFLSVLLNNPSGHFIRSNANCLLVNTYIFVEFQRDTSVSLWFRSPLLSYTLCVIVFVTTEFLTSVCKCHSDWVEVAQRLKDECVSTS